MAMTLLATVTAKAKAGGIMKTIEYLSFERMEMLAGSFRTKKMPGVNFIKLFSSLLMMRPNKLECLYLAISYQSILTFVGNTRSSPKKEASERSSNWVCSCLALKF
jgi:hypothetical protein